MKGTHIKLDAAQLQEAASLYGSMRDFRKAIAGTVVLGGDGAISLDSWWQAMANQFPDFFDADRNSNDMPGALVQAVESLRSMKTDIMDEFGTEAVRRSILPLVFV